MGLVCPKLEEQCSLQNEYVSVLRLADAVENPFQRVFDQKEIEILLFGKRPEFPSGMTSGMKSTISSWFTKGKRELGVAFAGGDRYRRSGGSRS